MMTFIGYTNGVKGFKFMRKPNNIVFQAVSALFDENIFPHCPDYISPGHMRVGVQPPREDNIPPEDGNWFDGGAPHMPPHFPGGIPPQGQVPPAPQQPPLVPQQPLPQQQQPQGPQGGPPTSNQPPNARSFGPGHGWMDEQAHHPSNQGRYDSVQRNMALSRQWMGMPPLPGDELYINPPQQPQGPPGVLHPGYPNFGAPNPAQQAGPSGTQGNQGSINTPAPTNSPLYLGTSGNAPRRSGRSPQPAIQPDSTYGDLTSTERHRLDLRSWGCLTGGPPSPPQWTPVAPESPSPTEDPGNQAGPSGSGWGSAQHLTPGNSYTGQKSMFALCNEGGAPLINYLLAQAIPPVDMMDKSLPPMCVNGTSETFCSCLKRRWRNGRRPATKN